MQQAPQALGFQEIFESCPTSYLALASDFTISAANEAQLRMTNTRRENLIGRPLLVTERAVMARLDEGIEILSRIKSLGVKVALDDFGTGYSSLSLLSSLPLDKLKVDQSFLRSIENNRASQAVTEAIIALGRSLKLEVIGEGIESEQAFRYLKKHGCNQAQGSWFSQPLPATQFVYWHRQRRMH